MELLFKSPNGLNMCMYYLSFTCLILFKLIWIGLLTINDSILLLLLLLLIIASPRDKAGRRGR